MSSPDVTPYVDLRVFDRNAQTIFEAARALLEARLPGIVLREGTTEVALMEGQALIADELTFAVNRLPGAITEILLKLYGIERDAGEAAVGEVEFTAVNTSGYVIPINTSVRVDVGSGEVAEFFTTEAVATPAGQLTAVVPIEATSRTTLGNAIPVGTTMTLLSPLSFVQSVIIVTETSGGRDEELPSDFLNRGVQALRRLVNTLVLPEHFTAAALSDPRVFRATTIDLYDPASGNDPGEDAGHVSVAVLGPDAQVLSAPAKAELDALLTSQTQANLAVHVIDPTITTVDVTVVVHRKPGYADADVQSNVEAALEQHLSPLTWAWSGTVRVNELISLIDRVSGVDYVETPTVPAADVVLGGVANLVSAGDINVTVEAP